MIHDHNVLFVVKYSQTRVGMRPNKLRRHVETKHPDLNNHPLIYFETKLKELKTSKTKINEKAMHSS